MKDLRSVVEAAGLEGKQPVVLVRRDTQLKTAVADRGRKVVERSIETGSFVAVQVEPLQFPIAALEAADNELVRSAPFQPASRGRALRRQIDWLAPGC